jgi:hypothetical protein
VKATRARGRCFLILFESQDHDWLVPRIEHSPLLGINGDAIDIEGKHIAVFRCGLKHFRGISREAASEVEVVIS